MDNAKILIVYTGGTIGMVETPQGLQPFDFSHLMDNVPKLSELGYTIDSVQFKTPIDSSNMNPGFWNMIVKDIADNYEKYDGFVILHGTDTMAYTASALAFMLRNLRKPVVVTGSQLPIGDVREDGTQNLVSANDRIVRIRHNPSQSVSTACFTARFFNALTDGF